MKNKFIKDIPRNIIIIIVLILLTFKYILKDFSRQDFISAIYSIKPYFIIISIVLSVLYIIFEGINTKYLLEFFGYKTKILKTVGYSFTGYFFSGLTPSATGGQPMQILAMKTDGIKVSHSSIVLMIELCCFQFVSIIFAIIGFAENFDYIFYNKGVNVWIIYYGILSNILIFLFIFFVIFSNRFVKFVKVISFFVINKLSFIKRKSSKKRLVLSSLHEYRKSAVFIKSNPKIILRVLLVQTIQVICIYSIAYVVYKAFSNNKASFLDVLFLQSLAFVSVSSMPIPGAIGISEKIFQFLFLIIYSKNDITDALLLTRGIGFYILFTISAVVFFLSFWKKISEHSTIKQREIL